MKNRVMLVLLGIMFIMASLFGTYKPLQSQEKIIELSFSTQEPVSHFIAKGIAEWTQRIEKSAAGRVKITVHYGGTLTSPVACYEGVVNNISDIGSCTPAHNRGRFPLMEVADLPGYPFNAIVTSRVGHDLYKKFKPKEFDDTHVLYSHAHIPGCIFTRAKPVRSLEDLKGLRIRCTGLAAKIVTSLGATPVAMPWGEIYDALQRGVVDGTVGAPNMLWVYKMADVTKYLTNYPPVGYVTNFVTVMNKKKWDSLPPDIQKIFTEVSEEWPEYLGKAWNDGEIEGFQYGKKIGFNFLTLSPEEARRWDNAVKPIFDEYVKAMEAKGLPGKEALEYRRQLIEKYNKLYPQLKLD